MQPFKNQEKVFFHVVRTLEWSKHYAFSVEEIDVVLREKSSAFVIRTIKSTNRIRLVARIGVKKLHLEML